MIYYINRYFLIRNPDIRMITIYAIDDSIGYPFIAINHNENNRYQIHRDDHGSLDVI